MAEFDKWRRYRWPSENDFDIIGPDLFNIVLTYIHADLAEHTFCAETIADLLAQQEGVMVEPRTIRELMSYLIQEGEVIIVQDGRGPGGVGSRLFQSLSCRQSPIIDPIQVAQIEAENAILADFYGDRRGCFASRGSEKLS